MTIIKQVFPQCEFCGETFPDVLYATVKECRLDMRSGGWRRVEGKDKCPDCAEGRSGAKP